MITRFLPLLSLILTLGPRLPAYAERLPLSVAELQNEADAIVVANIEHIRIELEPSRFERGFGNRDWGIYLTLTVLNSEKGNVFHERLEARCFRAKSRRSVIELLTPSGHHPIPGTGTRVRAYLAQQNGSWSVVLPNGITSVENANEFPEEKIEDASEVTRLRSRVFTYFLPMEIWVAVGIPVVVIGLLKWRRRKRRFEATEQHNVRSAAENT